jgi:DNA-binding beta-propeller fold protein YncE
METPRRRFSDRESPLWLRVILMLLLLGVAIAVFAIFKKREYPTSLTWGAYARAVAEQFAFWTGVLFWLSIILGHIVPRLVTGGKIDIPEFAQVVGNGVRKAGAILRNLPAAIAAILVTAVGFTVLCIVYVTLSRPLPPASAGVIVIPANPESTKLYVLREGNVLVYDRNQRDADGRMRALQNLFVADAGQLQLIAVTADERRVFVSDYDHGVVHVLDVVRATEDETHLVVGRTANAMAFSSDGRKLYVAVTGPSPSPHIAVFDAATLAPLTSIRNIGCPMSLFAASAKPYLFVATQCGTPEDPLYVIDTRDDRVVKRIPGFAIGSRVVASPDGKKVFVLSHDRMSIVTNWSAAKPSIRAVSVTATSLAISADGELLLVGTGKGIMSMDSRLDRTCQRIELEAAPREMVFTPDGWVYADLPDRLFVDHRNALECR